MNKKDLLYLKETFLKYTDGFIVNTERQNNPFILKKEHTQRVCMEIVRLTEKLSISSETAILAEAVALLHDIGRFRQYKEYGTFLDSESVNHAALGCEVIKEENILRFCTEKEQTLFLDVVYFHNAFALPMEKNKDTLFLLKLLRDADKLDIWKVVTNHYKSVKLNNNKFIDLGLEDDGKFSKEVLEFVINGQIVKNQFVKRLNDLKLLQISWLFDLNFSESITRLQEKGYLGKIFSKLPESEELKKVAAYVKDYIEQRTA